MKLTKSFRPFYIVNFSLLKTSSTHKRHKVLKRKQKDRATVNRNPKRKWRQVVTRQKLCPPRKIVWFLLAATSNHVPPTQTFLGVRHAFVGQERVTNCLRSYQAPTILDKINGKPRPPSPPKNGAFLPFARLHPCFGGDGGLLFHFILSKIVAQAEERCCVSKEEKSKLTE